MVGVAPQLTRKTRFLASSGASGHAAAQLVKPVEDHRDLEQLVHLRQLDEQEAIAGRYAEVAENDIKRQKRLESLGYFVLRFTDGEVLTAIDRVYQNILAGGGGG